MTGACLWRGEVVLTEKDDSINRTPFLLLYEDPARFMWQLSHDPILELVAFDEKSSDYFIGMTDSAFANPKQTSKVKRTASLPEYPYIDFMRFIAKDALSRYFADVVQSPNVPGYFTLTRPVQPYGPYGFPSFDRVVIILDMQDRILNAKTYNDLVFSETDRRDIFLTEYNFSYGFSMFPDNIVVLTYSPITQQVSKKYALNISGIIPVADPVAVRKEWLGLIPTNAVVEDYRFWNGLPTIYSYGSTMSDEEIIVLGNKQRIEMARAAGCHCDDKHEN